MTDDTNNLYTELCQIKARGGTYITPALHNGTLTRQCATPQFVIMADRLCHTESCAQVRHRVLLRGRRCVPFIFDDFHYASTQLANAIDLLRFRWLEVAVEYAFLR